MGLMDNVKGVFTKDRVDVWECNDCEEIVKVEPGEIPDSCPVCGSGDLTLINRRAVA